MRRRLAIGGAAVVVTVGVAVFAAARLSADDSEPWPPQRYASATKNQEQHLATWSQLRRRALRSPDVDFPPSPGRLELLRFAAVGAASRAGDARPSDARVYSSKNPFASEVIRGAPSLAEGASVYVVALRGKFSTAGISHPLGVKPTPEFRPMLILVYDAATMNRMSSYVGRTRDLSPLGESIELDLDPPLSRG